MYRIFLFYSAAVSGKGGKCEKFWTSRKFVSPKLYAGKSVSVIMGQCDYYYNNIHVFIRALTRETSILYYTKPRYMTRG